MPRLVNALLTTASILRLARLPWAARRAVDLAVYLATADELFRR